METNTNSNLQGISILIPSYNTPQIYLVECINSIIKQSCINHYRFEIVWINDGSNEKYTLELEESLKLFNNIPTIYLIYNKLDINKGIVDALNHGLDLCTNELIFRMDADDIMHVKRIQKQVDFMNKNPKCMILGTLIKEFNVVNGAMELSKRMVHAHPEYYSSEDFLKNPIPWFMNHPTLCYRKHAIEQIGKYNSDDPLVKYSAMEDHELQLRFLKNFGAVYNLQEVLLYYRMHASQITKTHKNVNQNEVRKYMIDKIFYNK